jgi:hypothetical protein
MTVWSRAGEPVGHRRWALQWLAFLLDRNRGRGDDGSERGRRGSDETPLVISGRGRLGVDR